MSQMPERVWVVPSTEVTDGVVTAWDAFADKVRKFFAFDDRCPSAVPYVPEQRALAAERERDEANKELLLLHAQYRQVSNLEALRVREVAALRAERDALRADLLALVPLAKYALPLWEDCGPNERLRAILARVATEGAS